MRSTWASIACLLGACGGTTTSAPSGAPEVKISARPPEATREASATVEFACADRVCTFTCALDGGAFTECSSPYSVSALAEGPHRLLIRGLDPESGQAAPEVEVRWTSDRTAPITTFVWRLPEPTSSPLARVELVCSESACLFECALDGGAFAACTSPYERASLADGAHRIQVRASDPAGNVEDPPAERAWTIDTVAPTTTIVSGPPATTTSSTARFELGCNEIGCRFICELDMGVYSGCPSPHVVEGLAPGMHSLYVRAEDRAGNRDDTGVWHRWTVN